MSGNVCKCFLLPTRQISNLLTVIDSRYKSWKLCGIYPFVTLLFTAGYALREVGAFHYKYPENKESLMIYIMNQVLIYAGP